MIGAFGNIAFTASANRIRTFDGLTREVSVRYATHEVIGRKPVLEFLGNDLDTLSFTMTFNSSFGVDPIAEIDQLEQIAKQGVVSPLVIGGIVYGSYVIEKISETFDTIIGGGRLTKASVSVSLKEFN